MRNVVFPHPPEPGQHPAGTGVAGISSSERASGEHGSCVNQLKHELAVEAITARISTRSSATPAGGSKVAGPKNPAKAIRESGARYLMQSPAARRFEGLRCPRKHGDLRGAIRRERIGSKFLNGVRSGFSERAKHRSRNPGAIFSAVGPCQAG